MTERDGDLQRWREAGLIDEATAARIRDFEARRTRERNDRPSVPEALLYVGLVAFAVGAFTLGALLWDELTTVARFVSTFAPGAIAVILGAVMLRSDSAALRRGGSVAWMVAVALLAGSAAIALEANDVSAERAFLGTATIAVVLAAVAWVIAPANAQIWALAGALGLLTVSIAVAAEEGEWTDEGGVAIWAGLTICLAIAWLVAAELGWLTPEASARVLGAMGLVVGAYVGGFDEDYRVAFEIAVLVAGAALVAASVARGVFVYMGAGVVALFLGAITIVMRRVPDPVVGAMVIMLGGVALVVTVLILAKARPWRQEDAAGA